MLRLAPTEIVIGSRDLAWHAERHEARQSQRANGYRVEVIGSPTRPLSETTERAKSTLPYRFTPLSIRKTGVNPIPDGSSISKDPVPRGSRLFWDNILAEAGPPLGIQVKNIGRRPRIVEQSDESDGVIRSSQASIEEDSQNPTEPDYTTLFDPKPFLRPGSPSEYASVIEYAENSEDVLTGNDFDGRPHQFDLPIRSSSLLNSGKKRMKEDSSVNRGDLSHSRYLDGCSDFRPFDPMKSGSADDVESESNFMQYSARGFQIRTAAKSRGGVELDFPEYSHMTSESFSSCSSPQLPLPRSVDNFRRRSGGLPRSPLYISQAAASSSPEKRPRASKTGEGDSTMNVGLLAQPPRRRKTYKPYSPSYPFDVSETSLISSYPDANEDISTDEPCRNSSPISPFPSTPESDGNIDEESIHSSPILKPGLSPARFNWNTQQEAFPSLRHPLPLPPIPPRPFSATPRTASFNYALPSSSISPNPSPPSVHNSSPSLTPRRIRVYNDRLPASSQPQTPARLPRNGLPPLFSQSQYGIGIGIQTAPAGNGRRRESIGSTTPTRRRGRTSEDQENLGIVAEVTRRLIMDRRRGERVRDLDGEEDESILGPEM